MHILPADILSYSIIRSADTEYNRPIYPYFRKDSGITKIISVSPQHGRSYIVGKDNDGRFIISKGNGLSYTTISFIKTADSTHDVWGLLLKQDAIRDFELGNEIASLGILTNRMEYVIELDYPIPLSPDRILNPVLLQYSVECPYRITDAMFINRQLCMRYAEKWAKKFDMPPNLPKYLIASDVILKALSKLHQNDILHNAITSQNITWSLELLDFELACSPSHPYSDVDSQRHYINLFERELIFVYQIILDIAGVLGEIVDYSHIEDIFKKYKLSFPTQKEYVY